MEGESPTLSKKDGARKYGKWTPATVVENLNEPLCYNVKIENGSMYRRNQKHLLKRETDEDQTIELSDDEDEAKIAQVKYEDVKNDEERRKLKETIRI